MISPAILIDAKDVVVLRRCKCSDELWSLMLKLMESLVATRNVLGLLLLGEGIGWVAIAASMSSSLSAAATADWAAPDIILGFFCDNIIGVILDEAVVVFISLLQ